MERSSDSAPLLVDARDHTRESLFRLAREARATARRIVVDHCYILDASTIREVGVASEGRVSFLFSARPDPDQTGS
jgi:hypothetical protein